MNLDALDTRRASRDGNNDAPAAAAPAAAVPAAPVKQPQTFTSESRHFLDELLLTPSPTGAEQTVQRLVRDRFRHLAHVCETDPHGNLVLALHPDRPRKVMLAAHADQLGFLVKYVSDDGYLYLDPLGGNDYGVLLGERVTIHARTGPIPCIVGRKPVHLQSGKETSEIPVPSRIWVDIGAKSRDEALEHVRLGDYATVNLQVTPLLNDRIAAPGLDNKAGLFVCLEALRQCASESLDIALYVVSTVQEEIGSRGARTAAAAIRPDVGIAVDVVNATDDPSLDKPQQEVQCTLGGGPAISIGPGTNPQLGKLLCEAADRSGIPWQPAPSGKTASNDADPLQVSGRGVATASVGIPQRNMHTQVEVCSLTDIEDTIRLLVVFLRSIDDDTDFRPLNFDGES